MSSSDPFLPAQTGPETPVDESEPADEDVEAERADSPDSEGDGPTDDGLPPMPATPFQRPDGEAVDPAGL